MFSEPTLQLNVVGISLGVLASDIWIHASPILIQWPHVEHNLVIFSPEFE